MILVNTSVIVSFVLVVSKSLSRLGFLELMPNTNSDVTK